MNTIWPVTFPEPNIAAIESHTKEPNIPCGSGRQNPAILPSLNDFNLPPNFFNVLATMAVVQPATRQCDERDNPLSPVPLELSAIWTPLINVRTVQGWEISSDVGTFSSDEPRRNYPVPSPSPTPPPPRRQKRKLSTGMPFPQKGRVSEHNCKAFCQPLRAAKHPNAQSKHRLLDFCLNLK